MISTIVQILRNLTFIVLNILLFLCIIYFIKMTVKLKPDKNHYLIYEAYKLKSVDILKNLK